MDSENQLAGRLSLIDLVLEYNERLDAMPAVYESYIQSKKSLEMSCSVMGTYGGSVWGSGNPDPCPKNIQKVLLVSAWKRVYSTWINQIATAKDKAKIKIMLENPPEFTIDNLKDQFGDYVADPWGTVLRGVAEVFCGLDPFYKSHTKVAIGKKGLPKRVIISGFSCYSSYGKDKLTDIINAIRAYRKEPIINYADVSDWVDAARKTESSNLFEITQKKGKETGEVISIAEDDLRLKIFGNGNGHVLFGEQALEDINKALAEYYGEVLPDVDVHTNKKRSSTDVSKDLQYYPTPKAAIQHLLNDVHISKDDRVLEPSCGCGRLMDAVKPLCKSIDGIEYDQGRANLSRNKGHSVTVGNFLEVEPSEDYDVVVMNPPFYGKHYIKHIEAAIKWLKPEGVLVSILPSTARYDHKLITKDWAESNKVVLPFSEWRDLPVGSFSESGTNINTSILKLRKQSS